MRVTSKPANENDVQDIDTGGKPDRLRRYEQCLERRKEATNYRAGKAGLDATAYRAGDRCASRDGRRLPEDRGYRGSATPFVGTAGS